ncbi:hypothetical protein LZ30DRAFT_724722 [Colletotrichum cereale]|nr:hypothetical protein LZ30DRAFT_724722 [Colletotrichum cereale]
MTAPALLGRLLFVFLVGACADEKTLTGILDVERPQHESNPSPTQDSGDVPLPMSPSSTPHSLQLVSIPFQNQGGIIRVLAPGASSWTCQSRDAEAALAYTSRCITHPHEPALTQMMAGHHYQ